VCSPDIFLGIMSFLNRYMIAAEYARSFFGNPSRVPHKAAKVPAVEKGILVGDYIGEAGTVGGLGPMLQAVVKGLQKVFRKS
jgi:hypothetical protein